MKHYCPTCSKECAVASEFTMRGVVYVCLQCGSPAVDMAGGASTPPPAPTPQLVPASPSKPVRRPPPFEVPVQERRTPPARPLNVVQLARRRLRQVEQQLRTMRTLEAEAAELRRLLAAAGAKAPNVHPLEVPASRKKAEAR